MVIIYAHEDNYELMMLTAQKASRDEELDACTMLSMFN
jgi:hypothetical protein